MLSYARTEYRRESLTNRLRIAVMSCSTMLSMLSSVEAVGCHILVLQLGCGAFFALALVLRFFEALPGRRRSC